MTIENPTSPAVRAVGPLLFALALGAFAIGLSEFVIMGLLPQVSEAMHVSLAEGSRFISYYALGVVIGAPLFSLSTARLSRKHQLMIFITLFLGGNVSSMLADSAHALVISRFLSGLPHGAFLGVAALAAASLVEENRRGQAVGRVMLGLTLASLLGNPAATLLGEHLDWRWAFACVSLLSLADALLIFKLFPQQHEEAQSSPLKEIRGLANSRIWLTLGIAAIGFGGMFAVISYITPILTLAAHLSTLWLPVVLFAFGLGMVLGNLAGGKLADRKIMLSIFCILAWSVLVLTLFPLMVSSVSGLLLGAFLIGTNLALCAPLQVRLMQVAGKAQTLAATLNHSAFNIANALGAFLGAWVVQQGYPMTQTASYGAVLPLMGMVIFAFALLKEVADRKKSAIGATDLI
ncbi:MFS transporter [Erwinia sp. 198]|uniref:MFS transporter n=1 Tax=Erwinia sp. 198 TaxID=2022746 RepID=UPI000F675712|nr:MFS transporter [Erwinia sp. 198]RRZ96969.1 MFS transporter [Erwinia sp. 198]